MKLKKSDSLLHIITSIFVVSLVVSNVVTAKLWATGITLFGVPLTMPGAAVCYAFTFLATDIIGEIWGKKQANKTVLFGFIGQIFASLLILFTQYLPAANPESQEAYNTLLGQNWVFVIGSLVAYYISQSWDVWIFHRIRDKFIAKHGSTKGGRWIWNNASTMTSQIWDTVIFIGISFGLGFGWFFQSEMLPTLFCMMLGQYVFKAILAALDTPIFYIVTSLVKKGEEAEATKEVA